ncbi:hypothetical protein [Embleya sp. AB8]|uniref:hypothetical protein n=1 Tax=Embleya sp. AB8 TaxID=3156304 RepID=UPI003C736885
MNVRPPVPRTVSTVRIVRGVRRLVLVGSAVALTTTVLTGCSAARTVDGRDGEPVAKAVPPSGTPGAPGVKRPDGAELLVDRDGTNSAQNPAFSPDGASMVFTVFHSGYNAGGAALRVLPAGGGPARTLLDEPDKAAVNLPGTSWHATGGITFASDRAGAPEEIWVVKPDGGEPVRVTRHSGPSTYLEPSFSPAGDWIVFQEATPAVEAKPLPDGGELGSLWKVRPDGTGLVRLLDGPATATDNRQPNWSPKGDRVVFQRRAKNAQSWALYVLNSDGTGLRRVTHDVGEHTDATWSPDGRSLVFSSTAGGLEIPQVFVANADTGDVKRVTHNDTGYDGAPSWSPDGKWIAFESHPGAADAPTSLWRIPAPA